MAGLTIDDPVAFSLALGSSNIIPGDTLLLRAGTYTGNHNVIWNGNAGNKITIKNYPGERVTINGQLTISSNHIRVIGLEIANNATRDRSAAIGTDGIKALGDHIEIVNCVVHDHDQGLTAGATRTGHVYYGNLFYFNGWNSHLGHGIYPQNNAGRTKTIKRNFLFDNFGYGIHAYGSAGDVSNFIIDGNTAFENGAPRSELQDNILNGNQSSFTGARIFNNMTYSVAGQTGSGVLRVGYGVGNQALDVEVYNNYLVGDDVAMYFTDATISRFDGNTLITTLTGASLDDWPNNTQLGSRPASGSNIVLTDNEYDANRAQLTVYNWALANTIDVDVSAVFGASGTVKAYNVQDYFADIQTLTITAGVITVNMQAANRTVATPIGWTAPAKTFPQFGAFVLVKQ